MKRVFGKLRIEKSKENSGTILRDSNIPILKEKDYFIVDQEIDGDAPKQFIKVYFYKKTTELEEIILIPGFHIMLKLPKSGILMNRLLNS
ncbi:MAG: hypothetical protein K1X82_08285 [Bacteroidia bacterium]|nr:hypothetical protein [Bacteroidia bacterium]